MVRKPPPLLGPTEGASPYPGRVADQRRCVIDITMEDFKTALFELYLARREITQLQEALAFERAKSGTPKPTAPAPKATRAVSGASE